MVKIFKAGCGIASSVDSLRDSSRVPLPRAALVGHERVKNSQESLQGKLDAG
mgnify:FL=1